jgi:hypothetical protein
MTPRELGKWAKLNGINAPTLDRGLDCWLKGKDSTTIQQHYIAWWDGWYEALDESLSFQQESFTRQLSAA